jgi:hypothetical protein
MRLVVLPSGNILDYDRIMSVGILPDDQQTKKKFASVAILGLTDNIGILEEISEEDYNGLVEFIKEKG